MKNREQKQKDLVSLTEQLKKSNAAMLIGFHKLTVAKDLELRNQLREAGVEYRVVKNTLARTAVEGTPFEMAKEHFKGVTAMAMTENDPVNLAKAVSKYAKGNPDVFTFKVGIVEGNVVALRDVDEIASLPSKDVLISKVMFLINCQAQRLVTVIAAVPRNLAIVVKQIGDQKGEAA